MWRNSLRIFVLLWIARLLIESRTTRALRSGCFRKRNSTLSMMFSSIVGLSTTIAWAWRFAWDIMIWLMQSTNHTWSIGISRTSSAPMMLWLGIVAVTKMTSMSLLIANRSSMPWRASKYWSDFKRSDTAEESGSALSFSATSAVTPFSTTRGHAPAFQERDEEHPGRRQVEHVLGPAVRGAPHLDDLERPEEVPSALEIPGDDHAIGQGLLDAPTRVPFVGRADLGDEEGRAAFRTQDGAEPEEEVADALLVL